MNERTLPPASPPAQADPVIEAVAEAAHVAWVGWMRYLYSRCEKVQSGVWAGSVVIPNEWRDRWRRQMETPYADLTEAEKESDREEARKFLRAADAPRAHPSDAKVRSIGPRPFIDENPVGPSGPPNGEEESVLLDVLRCAICDQRILDRGDVTCLDCVKDAHEDPQKTLDVIARMLGWMNTPPRRVFEQEINALKSRVAVSRPHPETPSAPPKDES